MLEHNLRLNNFFGCELAQSKMKNTPSEKEFSISLSGKFYEIGPTCHCCGSTSVAHNGNDRYKNKVIRELGITIKRGKRLCKRCNSTWTTHYNDAELFVQQYKQLITSTVFNLCAFDASLNQIVEHISSVFGKMISHEWVRRVYIKAAKNIEQKKALKTSGIFHYDEQYIKVNKKEYVRIVVIDAITKRVIFDEVADNNMTETLKDKLNMKMLPYKKEAFIVDLALGYPRMLKELFPEVKVQWCLFHLNKLILNDFERSKRLNKYGKKVLPLQELYNQYLMLNLFFNHEAELRFLKRQLKKLDENKFMIMEGNLISFYEMKLISEFSEFRKGLKKNRRKHGKYLLKNNKEKTLELLGKLEREINLFPKQAKKRIKMIRKNIDKLTLLQDNHFIPPTNNALEQYYSATLQKTEKKRFRRMESPHLKLKIVREKWNKTLGSLRFNFLEFLNCLQKYIISLVIHSRLNHGCCRPALD